MKARRRRAFTLVELLVVIIIIGILAAVAIPQFGDSSTDAKKSALKENLRLVRSAVDKFHIQHNSTYPGVIKQHYNGTATAAHTTTADAFVKQLTCWTDVNGNTSDVKDASYPYPPYVRNKLPDNALPAAGAVATPSTVNVTTDVGRLTVDGTPTTGWKYSNETGEFICNNSDYADY